MTYLVRIEAPYFVAGAVCEGDRVIRCADIINWSRVAGARKLKAWARGKGFKVEQWSA